MANYGQLLDDFQPEKENVYKAFSDYFNNPTLTKIKNVDNHYSVYMAKTYCLLSTECRYIVVIVELDQENEGSSKQLKDINWVSFQTRTLSDNHNLPPHNYNVVSKGPLLSKITRIKKDDNGSTYRCEDFPIQIMLLNTPKKNNFSYQDNGNVIAALETWETIVTFV